MRRVQIADLKNNLSEHLRFVRSGREVLICDRRDPIARIVPLEVDSDAEERTLVADGLLRLPNQPFDSDAFFALGARSRSGNKLADLMTRAVKMDREESDARILGLKLRRPSVRSRSSH